MRIDAYERLLDAITFGDLPAGSNVDERLLVRRYGLGQAAVRDALFRLSLEGLVDRRPRIGTRIADLGLRELQNLYEARAVIECYACALAAMRAHPDEIAVIRAGQDAHAEAAENRDVRKLVELDRGFHRGLAAASRNAELEQAVIRLHNNHCRFWVFGLERASAEEMRAQGRAHLDILDAIENKDMAAIERCVRIAIGYIPDSRFVVYQPRLLLGMQPRAAAE
jgi:DNA-binding GntR family transcriptional regulator